jgi:hypothetical protein
MDVSNVSFYIDIHQHNENKGSGMGHTKKTLKKNIRTFKPND